MPNIEYEINMLYMHQYIHLNSTQYISQNTKIHRKCTFQKAATNLSQRVVMLSCSSC